MRVGKIRGANLQPAEAASAAEPAPAASATSGRALIALKPVPAPQAPAAHYRQAPFLAQLIATKDQHPQTRERRRAEPADAIAAYRAMAEFLKS